MSAVASDVFTGSTGTDIAGTTPTLGAAWAQVAGLGAFLISDANRARCGNATGGPHRAIYIPTSPASAEYDVQSDFYTVSTSLIRDYGVCGRLATDGTAGYALTYNQSSTEWRLLRITAASTTTTLGTYTQSLSATTTYAIKLEIRDATKKVYIDGVERISSADNTTTAAGYGGLYAANSGAGGNGNGAHLDNFSITDIASVGTLSQTLGNITLSGAATAAAGGAATGTLSATLGNITLTGSATFVTQPSNGTLSVALAAITLSGAATFVTQPSNGTLAATLGAITLTGSGSFVAPTGSTGTLAATLGAITLTASALASTPDAYDGPTFFIVTIVNPDVEPAMSQVTSGDVDPARSQVTNS